MAASLHKCSSYEFDESLEIEKEPAKAADDLDWHQVAGNVDAVQCIVMQCKDELTKIRKALDDIFFKLSHLKDSVIPDLDEIDQTEN
jgi:hypothetical protein